MAFTIEVKKRGKDEEFSFEDLELFHQECFGGEIKITQSEFSHIPRGYNLTCQRCKSEREIDIRIEAIGIIKTAIDGKEREMELSKAPYVNMPDNIIIVIQKD